MKNRINVIAPIATLVVILLVNMVTFYYSQCNSASISSTDYKGNSQTITKEEFRKQRQILSTLPEDNREALSAVTQYIYNELGYQVGQISSYQLLYIAKTNMNNDVLVYFKVQELIQTAIAIENMRSSITANAQAISTSHIFDESENGQNIAATAKDFYSISTMVFPLELDNGINAWMNYRITDYLVVLLAVALAVFVSVYNRVSLEKNIQRKHSPIIPGGAILAVGIASMYVLNAFFVYRFIDSFELKTYVQSFISFKYCPIPMQLWTFILAMIVMKAAIGLMIYGLIVAIMHCSEKNRPIMIGCIAVFVIAEIILAYGGRIAPWFLTKEINVFSAFTFERFFITYENLSLFGSVISRLPVFIVFIVLIMAGIFIMCRYSVVGYSAKMHEQLQYRYYEEINQKYTETRQLWHDFHNHLLAIQELMRRGEIDAANNYVKELEDDIDHAHILTKSGSEALDVLIYQKSELARQANVKLDVRINTRVKCEEFQDTAICCVVGNLLDNCIEAVSKLDNRYATLEISKKGDMLLISTENCFDGKVEKDAKGFKTTKSDKASHGIGLAGVKRICEKYNGSMLASAENNVFRVQALMMAKKSKKR